MNINFRKTVFLSVAADISQCPPDRYPEVVLTGRSNVGKSSFINSIGDNRTLAKVSSMPGKTRLVVYFLADGKLLFADLPGYGYSMADKGSKEKYQALADRYMTSGRTFALVILFIDIRHPLSVEDKMMKDWLAARKQPYLVILTKADKLSKLQVGARIRDFRSEADIPEEIHVLPLGNKDGIAPIRSAIAAMASRNVSPVTETPG